MAKEYLVMVQGKDGIHAQVDIRRITGAEGELIDDGAYSQQALETSRVVSEVLKGLGHEAVAVTAYYNGQTPEEIQAQLDAAHRQEEAGASLPTTQGVLDSIEEGEAELSAGTPEPHSLQYLRDTGPL